MTEKPARPILVISTEAKRSGEISPSDGTGGITVGDLSTQSIINAFSICPIPTRSPARDDGGGGHPWTHLRCEGSKGSEGKVLKMDRPLAGGFLSLTGPLAPRVVVAASPQIIKKAGPPPPVISTEAKRSGEISSSDGTGGITVGDLSTQSIINAFSICPIPTCSPARDDGGGGHLYRHVRRGRMTKNAAPIPVISTVAKRSGEISLHHGT